MPAPPPPRWHTPRSGVPCRDLMCAEDQRRWQLDTPSHPSAGPIGRSFTRRVAHHGDYEYRAANVT
jgi:hypothetical protein